MTKHTPRRTEEKTSDLGTETLYPWLSAQFDALRAEGQLVVDDYWSRLKSGRIGKKPYERGTLGLRLRSRDSGAFSLEWYEMGALGRTRKPVAKRHIAKGQSHRYSLRQVLRGQPEWLSPLVEETEEVLADLRKRQALLMKIRDAVVAYESEITGKTLTATGLLSNYRRSQSEFGGAEPEAER
jgi:hypothetical protein